MFYTIIQNLSFGKIIKWISDFRVFLIYLLDAQRHLGTDRTVPASYHALCRK